jgi:hypothetical protein
LALPEFLQWLGNLIDVIDCAYWPSSVIEHQGRGALGVHSVRPMKDYACEAIDVNFGYPQEVLSRVWIATLWIDVA